MTPSPQFATVVHLSPADFPAMDEARAAMLHAIAPALESIHEGVRETYAPAMRALQECIAPTLERIRELVLAASPTIAEIARAHADALRLADLYVVPAVRLQREFVAALIPAMTLARQLVTDMDTGQGRVQARPSPSEPHLTPARRLTLTEQQLLWAYLTVVIAWMVAACVLDATLRPPWLAFVEQHVYAQAVFLTGAGFAIKRLRR